MVQKQVVINVDYDKEILSIDIDGNNMFFGMLHHFDVPRDIQMIANQLTDSIVVLNEDWEYLDEEELSIDGD